VPAASFAAGDGFAGYRRKARIPALATDRVHYVLTDLLPTVGTTCKPRYY